MGSQFDDGKDEGALRTIGEVSAALGIRSHVLRYWEAQFPMLKPLKRSGGRRYYRPEDVALVREIDRLVNREGYTLKGANAALRDAGPDTRAASEPAPMPRSGELQPERRASTETVARLRAIRARLAAAIDA
jgi:DNA-binding transcriptional MerR regulator